MSHPVNEFILRPKDELVETKIFRQMVEDHLDIIREKSSSFEVPTDSMNLRCRYDYYALLNELGVRPDVQWVTMRMNGYRSPEEFLGDAEVVLLPDTQHLNGLMKRLRTTNALF